MTGSPGRRTAGAGCVYNRRMRSVSASLLAATLLGALACTPEPPGPCVPDCEARICGRDPVCGTICGPACPDDGVCEDEGRTCRPALPIGVGCAADLECGAGRVCLGAGSQAVGGYCSRRCGAALPCPDASSCGDAAGERFCLAPCAPAPAPDSCRVSEGYACSADGVCPACVPTCEGRSCGNDGCGGSCGLCLESGKVCSAGACGAAFRDADVLPEPARYDTVALLDNLGFVWLFGGREVLVEPSGLSYSGGLRKVDVYNPQDKAWTPGPALLPVRIAAPMIARVGTAFWLAGGTDDPGTADAPDGIVGGFYKYERQIWEPRGALPVDSRGGALVELGGKLFLFAGQTAEGPSDRVELYDPSPTAGTWSSQPPRPTARAFFAAASDGNRAYLLGGWDGTRAVGTIEIFDPATGWSTAPALKLPVAHARAVLADDRVFVFGGFDGETLELADLHPEVQELDLRTRQTTRLGVTPGSLLMQSAARLQSGKVLLFGGTTLDRGAPSRQNEVFEFLLPTR